MCEKRNEFKGKNVSSVIFVHFSVGEKVMNIRILETHCVDLKDSLAKLFWNMKTLNENVST